MYVQYIRSGHRQNLVDMAASSNSYDGAEVSVLGSVHVAVPPYRHVSMASVPGKRVLSVSVWKIH